MRIACGVCSIGLGHATRTLPIIKWLLEEGHEVDIISHGRALELLKRELEEYGKSVGYVDLHDYPLRYPEHREEFFPRVVMGLPRMASALIEEHRKYLALHRKNLYQLVISDNRYGVFEAHTPSFLITHQLRILNPWRVRFLEELTQVYTAFIAKYFTGVLVPDFEEDGMTGIMSHNLRFVPRNKVFYIGPITSFRRRDVPEDVDLFITISGPEPQRTIFEKTVLSQLDDLEGLNYYVSLGVPDGKGDGERVLPYLSTGERENLMSRSRVILSRSGYSTVMDLFFLGKRAFLVPTPGQPEQEYIARVLDRRGWAHTQSQEHLRLREGYETALRTHGFPRGRWTVDETMQRVKEIIGEYLE